MTKEYVYIVIAHDTTGVVRTMDVYATEESAKMACPKIWNDMYDDYSIRSLDDLKANGNVYWLDGLSNPFIEIEKREVQR